MLLNPRSPSYDRSKELKIKTDDTTPTKYFVCEQWNCTFSLFKFSTSNTSRCSKCGKFMDQEIHFKDITDNADADRVGCGVFVSDITTFIVTDDLCVMPHSPGCCIQLLIDLGVTDIGHLEERTVELGREQILNLLRLSLLFNSPLTYLVGLKTLPSQGVESFEQGKFNQLTSPKKEDSPSSKMVLQVSLQKSTGKLLFAEAEEDFVDFVFGFLAISIGTSVGTLMNGTSPLPYSSKNQIFPINGTIFPKCALVYYDPDTCSGMWYDDHIFTNRGNIDDGRFTFNDPRIGVDILNKWKVPLKDIERHTVTIGLDEGIQMLK
ncbi:RNA-directed DNA polymerase, eukaryota, reverse transcriptase zinc-binding domain protein, partial [Tanacetum coccineum]